MCFVQYFYDSIYVKENIELYLKNITQFHNAYTLLFPQKKYIFCYHVFLIATKEGTDPNCTDHSVYPSSTIEIGMTSVEKQARCLPVEKQASKLSHDKQL